MKQRVINIPVSDLNTACQDKNYLDALTLCTYIKLSYVSSVLKNASLRRVMQFASIGYAKAKRALECGLQHGLLTYDGNDLYASKLVGGIEYAVAIKAARNEGTTGIGRCGLSFTQLRDKIVKANLLNHISKVTQCSDSLMAYRNGSLRKGRRFVKVRRMSNTSHKNGLSKEPQLSNSRASKVAGVCKTKVRQLLKELVAEGQCTKQEQSIETKYSCADAKTFCKYMNRTEIGFGYLFAKNGKVFVQVPNIYRYIGDAVKLVSLHN